MRPCTPTTEAAALSADARTGRPRLTRRGRLAVTLTVAGLLLAAAAAYVVARTPVGPALGIDAGPPCRLRTAEGTQQWSREAAMTATRLAAVGVRLGAPADAVAVAVLSTLQARPDDALGPQRARDVYRRLPQRRPSRSARAVARALLGGDGPALTCTVPALTTTVGLDVESPGATGLTPRADAVRRELAATFGRQSLGGFAPGGVDSGHVAGSAHYDGRAIDVFFRPVDAAHTRRGWLQAQWAVAHAHQLRVATVIFDRRIWSAHRSLEGWRDYRYPGGPTDDPVLLHEDHVHVDVARGGTFG